MAELNAYNDLMDFLRPGEVVEALSFGPWGWGGGYGEPNTEPVPEEKQGVVLTLAEAEPLMAGWSFNGGFGSPDCYATWIWTDQRVIWVTQYDGSTGLSSMPRNPTTDTPYMPGG